MNRGEKIKRVTEILSPYNLHNADRAVAEHIIDSLVREDECREGFDKWGSCECSVCKKVNTEIAKRKWREFWDAEYYSVGNEGCHIDKDDFLDWLNSLDNKQMKAKK